MRDLLLWTEFVKKVSRKSKILLVFFIVTVYPIPFSRFNNDCLSCHYVIFLSFNSYSCIVILSFSRYREVEPTDPLITWLWSTLESFSNEERILFMRFVSGRSRLPTTVSDISQRFQIVKVDRVSQTYTPVSFRWLFIWPLLFENIGNALREHVLCG